MPDENPRPAMRGRDWLIVAMRAIGVWAIFSAATQVSFLGERTLGKWLTPPVVTALAGPGYGRSMSSAVIYDMYSSQSGGSLMQSLTPFALGLALVIGAPLLAQVCYGREDKSHV